MLICVCIIIYKNIFLYKYIMVSIINNEYSYINNVNKTVEDYYYNSYKLKNYMGKYVYLNVYAVPETEENIIDFNLYGQFVITIDGFIYLYSLKELEEKKLIYVIDLIKLFKQTTKL
jgi:hypothetical protein